MLREAKRLKLIQVNNDCPCHSTNGLRCRAHTSASKKSTVSFGETVGFAYFSVTVRSSCQPSLCSFAIHFSPYVFVT